MGQKDVRLRFLVAYRLTEILQQPCSLFLLHTELNYPEISVAYQFGDRSPMIVVFAKVGSNTGPTQQNGLRTRKPKIHRHQHGVIVLSGGGEEQAVLACQSLNRLVLASELATEGHGHTAKPPEPSLLLAVRVSQQPLFEHGLRVQNEPIPIVNAVGNQIYFESR